ncbi:hypothetical protein DCS_07669 [Drechmeria coniospora]|uniref:Uncharacterized protein n=1 Tax=Drechmeria coniospora TaxID=98403 RepID=A0A151GF38_DRECN|nr:hypothetical protein DCS_07669 [Drechmeria coniospora]KYK55705.1 hypothetical protein DCS_07669 [Drechmeria coniospora]
MTAQVHAATEGTLLRPRREPLSPEYRGDDGEYVELNDLSSSTTTSVESLPRYEAVIGLSISSSAAASPAGPSTNLHATHTFQIETLGHPLIALPFSTTPVPILIYRVLPTGTLGPLAYQSLRQTRRSGNSVLVKPDDHLAEQPLCSTSYRFGPKRPPHMQLLGEAACDEVFEVHAKGCHTRAQGIRTHLGTFRWRYASRAERRAAGADSLVVLDLVTSVALAGGKSRERRRRIAQLVRNDEWRTKGTRGCTAGNGGRLMMDLGDWAAAKSELLQMEVLVIASCIVMLKKEVDRRKMQQMIIMAGGAGGGP